MNIKVKEFSGIISTGHNSNNTIINAPNIDDINWKRLEEEISTLKTASDASIKKFTEELSEPIKKRNIIQIKEQLTKWLPCIGSLIETSYYIIELASKFNIL